MDALSSCLDSTNRRPDFQELLTDIQLAVWVRQGAAEEERETPLASRIRTSLDDPATVSRFGGLSLGESTHLVDSVSRLNSEDLRGRLLVATEDGDLSLPIWPDHVGSNTRWGQYRLSDEAEITDEVLDQESPWTIIRRPALTLSTAN
ncbi:MAG: devS [Acidobacteria bacterium]|nr:devS [Acidobacteriota bacterium]